MAAKIFVSFTIVSTSDFFLVVREKAFPLAEVYRSSLLVPPHTQRNITVSPVNPVMHSVELWTTLDGINLDQLRGRCDIDASLNTTTSFDFITFVVGQGRATPHYDPADSDTQYVNPDINLAADGSNYIVFKSGFGAVDYGTHLNTLAGGGGFEFTDGQVFSTDEEYTIMINTLITNPIVTGSGTSFPGDVIEETDDFTIDQTHYNNLIEVNDVNNVVTIADIPDIDVIPENTIFGFNTHNGTQKYVTLQFPIGKYCLVNGVQRNSLYIGRAEEVSFIKKGNYFRIISWDGDYKRVGQRVQGDSIAPVNSLPETGGWYLKVDYPRLFFWYVNNLLLSEIVAGVDDVTPTGNDIYKWNIGLNKFWIPDTRGQFIKSINTGIVSGVHEAEQVGAHKHLSVSALRIGAHGGSSSVISGPVRLLVNTEASAPQGNAGSMVVSVDENVAAGTKNTVDNITSNFYRII